MGDTATAAAISTQIADMPQPDLLYQRLYVRTGIAALLGQPDEAMRLLQNSLSKGVAYGIELHRDMDLESLRGREDYQALLRPKG